MRAEDKRTHAYIFTPNSVVSVDTPWGVVVELNGTLERGGPAVRVKGRVNSTQVPACTGPNLLRELKPWERDGMRDEVMAAQIMFESMGLLGAECGTVVFAGNEIHIPENASILAAAEDELRAFMKMDGKEPEWMRELPTLHRFALMRAAKLVMTGLVRAM